MSSHNAPKEYLIIFIALLALTFVTAGAAFINFGALGFPIAMAIAVVKMMLVVWFFMHLREMTQLIKVFALGGIFWLVIMLTFTFSDYLTRENETSDPASTWIHPSASFDAQRDAPRFKHEAHSAQTSQSHH